MLENAGRYYWVQLSSIAQSCPTLCNPMDCSPASSFVHGISQARILEWVAISFPRRSSWPRDRTRISCLAGPFLTTPWWLRGKESVCYAGDVGSAPGSGISSAEGNGNPLQYSCLGNSMDRGVWWTTVHGVSTALQKVGHDWKMNTFTSFHMYNAKYTIFPIFKCTVQWH